MVPTPRFPLIVQRTKGGGHVSDVETAEPVRAGSGQAVHAAVLEDGSRRRRSRRLRRKLRPAGRAYADPGRRLFKHPTPARFVRFNVVGYHVTVLMERLMVAALAETTHRLDDEVATRLATYLDRHLIEEHHHDEAGGMTLEDMASIGVDPDAIRRSRPPVQIVELEELMLDLIRLDPVAVLGFLQLEQFHGTEAGVEAMIVATGLPRSAFRNLELHAHLDIGHGAALDRLLDQLHLDSRQTRLIYRCALVSIQAVRAALLEAVR